jgi:hypothetical protein
MGSTGFTLDTPLYGAGVASDVWVPVAPKFWPQPIAHIREPAAAVLMYNAAPHRLRGLFLPHSDRTPHETVT